MGFGWPARRLPAGERTPSYPARPTNLEETLKSFAIGERTISASAIALGIGLAVAPAALADDYTVDGQGAGPVQVAAADPSDAATPAAVQACGAFSEVLDTSSSYYGDFADSFEGSSYSDPSVDSSNAT